MAASIAEALSSAMEQAENEVPTGEAAEQEPQPAAAEAAPESGDTGRDEKGRFTAKESAPEPAQAAQPPVVSSPTAQLVAAPNDGPAMTPPTTWSAGAKAIFSQLPETARREIAKREQDYARGIQQHAEKAKGFDSLMGEFQPYEAMLRAEGGTPQGAIRDLMRTAYMLRTGTPQERGRVVAMIAERFGADLSPYLGQAQQQEQGQVPADLQATVQQLLSPYISKIQQWEQGQATAQQRADQQVRDEALAAIEAFRTATNEDGSPKYLYFENVKGLMAAYFSNGQADTMEKAYDMACWANPEVRAALQADVQRTAEANALAKAQRKAQDAGKAGFNVQGQGGVGVAGATTTSLRDSLSAQFDAAVGGARI